MVFFGCYDIAKLLIEYGAMVNMEDIDKQLPIHRTIFSADNKIFNLLVKYSMNVDEMINYKDKDGNTPLHLAILIKNYNIIKSLINIGASPYIMNNMNMVALDLAMNKNKEFDEIIIKIFQQYLKIKDF